VLNILANDIAFTGGPKGGEEEDNPPVDQCSHIRILRRAGYQGISGVRIILVINLIY